MAGNKFALAAALALALLAGESLGRSLLQGPPSLEAVDLSHCVAAPTDSVDPPPGATVTWSAPATGTRNFTCVGGKPVTLSGNQTGGGYYFPPSPGQENGRVGYAFFDLKPAGYYLLDIAKNKTVPAPGEASVLALARWPMAKASPGATHCDYITRTNTTGGAPPADCGSIPEGGELAIPYTSVYTCAPDAGSPGRPWPTPCVDWNTQQTQQAKPTADSIA
ncbi:hypothetical protein ABPG75_001343 [Micractinium tetrahymenae]